MSVPDPDWTDFNGSDPGITLAQLFTFLIETVLWRAGERQRRRRRRRAVLVGGVAAVGLAVWRWRRFTPDLDECGEAHGPS
jgi:hypothetical protein